MGTFLSKVGAACSCPKDAPHPPTNLRESDPRPTRCALALGYLVHAQEGLHTKAHAADEFALPAGEAQTISTHL